MATSLEELLKAALTLPAEARERLMHELSASLESASIEVDAETEVELLRRMASAEAGNVIDAREAMRQLRQRRG